jgi:hypothetical protein
MVFQLQFEFLTLNIKSSTRGQFVLTNSHDLVQFLHDMHVFQIGLNIFIILCIPFTSFYQLYGRCFNNDTIKHGN